MARAGILLADFLEDRADGHVRIGIVHGMVGTGSSRAHFATSGRSAIASIATSAPGAGSVV